MPLRGDRKRGSPSQTSEHGFALLIVLWSVVFLAFLMGQILGGGRTAANLSSNMRAAAQMRAADDGAISAALFHLLATGAAHWPADATPHDVTIGELVISVRSETLTGLVNPNHASAALLGGLLRAVGEAGPPADALAQAIIAWRSPASSAQAQAALADSYRAAGMPYSPPAAPFTNLDDLTYVLGMTPGLYEALKPHLSLFQPGDPDQTAADPLVQKALAFAGATDPGGGNFEGAPVVRVAACAQDGAALCRHAVASIAGLAASPPVQIEQLQDGP
jgi:general secretion pathway protein K